MSSVDSKYENLKTKDDKMHWILWNVCPKCEDREGRCTEDIGAREQLKTCVKHAEDEPDNFFDSKLEYPIKR